MTGQQLDKNSELVNDPVIARLFARMPSPVAASFTEEQLAHLKLALGARSWGSHSLDWRATVALPMVPWRFYIVFLCGRNRRQLREGERYLSAWATSVLMLVVAAGCVSAGLLLLYLAKSALGIDLIPGFSFGLWTSQS